MGKLEQSQEALAMLEYLRLRRMTSVITSQDIRDDFPDLQYPPGFNIIAGLLLVPLSVGGSDFIGTSVFSVFRFQWNNLARVQE